MCTPCRESLTAIELPPSRRKAEPCRGCNNMRFVRFAAGKLMEPPVDIRDKTRADKARWVVLDTFVGIRMTDSWPISGLGPPVARCA